MSNLTVGDSIRQNNDSYFIGNSSGSPLYAEGVLISLDPIVIVSSDSHNIWRHFENINDFIKIGIITNEEIIKECFKAADMSYKKYKRESSINDILYQEGDKVNLPRDEKGIIDSIDGHIPWGFRYSVKITESNGIFNDVGDIVEYKAEQFLEDAN